MPKLILVDAHGYIHRAYHALPPLTTSKGEPVNAIYGFVRMIFKLLREQKPDYFAVCFDSPGSTFRDKIFKEYKATRKETEDLLKSQFPLARELVEKLKVASFELEGYEADDLIATLAKRAEKDGIETVIVTGDKDMLQVVNDKIKVLNEPKQVLFDAEKVKERWGVSPSQLVDLFSLMGDNADNIPSVPGIGEKTAMKLIQESGTVENLFSGTDKIKQKVSQYQDQIKLAKQLLTLETSVPIQIQWDQCKIVPLQADLIVPFLTRMEFHSLINDLYAKRLLSTRPEGSADNGAQKNFEIVLTEKALQDLAQKLASLEELALDVETSGLNVQRSELIGISFCWQSDHAAYVPVGHRYPNSPHQLERSKVLLQIKPILENKKIKKIGHNLKFDHSVLIHAGIHLQNLYFDTMVASYCLDPSRSSHRLKDLVAELLQVTLMPIEELFPPSLTLSAMKSFPLDQLPLEKVGHYSCSQVQATRQLAHQFAETIKQKKCESLFYDLEMPLVRILTEMEMAGIKIDVRYLEELNQKFTKEINEIEKRAFAVAGQEFNLNSSKQLGFILFEKLRLPPSKKTKTGFSTDEEVLRSLANVHELPKLLIRHRELSKLRSTYIEGLLSELPQQSRDDTPDLLAQTRSAFEPDHDRIHTSFNQAVTSTGRLSSSEPNLQNIPIRTEYGRMIRRAFIPEKGCIFLSADYSQIDLRVLAHLTQDPALCEAFRAGGDIHRSTAAEVFHVPPKEVTDEQRKRAKAINFGIVYGQQSYGLSMSLGIPIPEAQELIQNYFKKYPGVKSWIDATIQEAKKTGYVKTLLGRIRYIPEINSKNGSMRAFAERMAMNTPVQGTSADIIKIAMIRIDAKISELGSSPKPRMLLQVHDDLLFEVPEKMAKDFAGLLKSEMESALKLSIPLIADVKLGTNWSEMIAG